MKLTTPRGVIAVYLTSSALFTLATSLIWAVNTLFLMRAGLDIFEVMVVNAAFTLGQLFFEIPTGVVADTLGRKTSFALGIGVLAVSTLLYVLTEAFGWGIGVFVVASLLLGLGFTFQTGAMDAWLVDALLHTGHTEPMEGVFAQGSIVFGIATLAGTIAGGVLGQVDLSLPYYVRGATLLAALTFVLVAMKEVGFTPRRLRLDCFAEEAGRVLRSGITHGWRHPVVRPLLFISLAQGMFFMFGFYSWQRYFLDLLALELVWVNGVVTALFSVAMICGNLLVDRVMRLPEGRRSGPRVLAVAAALQAGLTALIGVVGLVVPESAYGVAPFLAVAGLYLGSGLVFGIAGPVRQGCINRHIPSSERATVLSFDSFFGDTGASAGQLGLGYLSRAVSIPAAWLVGGAVLLVAGPLYRAAGRAEDILTSSPSDGEHTT